MITESVDKGVVSKDLTATISDFNRIGEVTIKFN